MKHNQRKRNESIEILLFIMVLAVFAAVLGIMALGEKWQPVNEIRQLSSGWYYFDDGRRTEEFALCQKNSLSERSEFEFFWHGFSKFPEA